MLQLSAVVDALEGRERGGRRDDVAPPPPRLPSSNVVPPAEEIIGSALPSSEGFASAFNRARKLSRLGSFSRCRRALRLLALLSSSTPLNPLGARMSRINIVVHCARARDSSRRAGHRGRGREEGGERHLWRRLEPASEGRCISHSASQVVEIAMTTSTRRKTCRGGRRREVERKDSCDRGEEAWRKTRRTSCRRATRPIPRCSGKCI